MDSGSMRALLERLHSGTLSRNRHYEELSRAEGRRAFHGYRRLRSLAREARAAGVEVSLDRAGTEWAVALRNPRLQYHRVVVLADWELDFLAGRLGCTGLAGAAPGPQGS